MEIIYCRGGDPDAPKLANAAGWRYGVRYDYTAYDTVYMLDIGLKPRWATYMSKVRKLRPHFGLVPDYTKPDLTALELYLLDLRPHVQRVGVCPKFLGAVSHLPNDVVICESIPTTYSGFLIPDDELLPNRDYHLLGGDPRLQLAEIQRIQNAGGCVVSVDGNKLMLKAAHGQVFTQNGWKKTHGKTSDLAQISAFEIQKYLN